MEGKICTKCNEYKLLSEYHKDCKNPFGVNSQCIKCRKPLKQIHYQNNKEKYKRAYQKFKNKNKLPNQNCFLENGRQ